MMNLIRQRLCQILGSLFVGQACQKLFILAARSQIFIIGSVEVVGCTFRALPEPGIANATRFQLPYILQVLGSIWQKGVFFWSAVGLPRKLVIFQLRTDAAMLVTCNSI